jgi:hypothetical protein
MGNADTRFYRHFHDSLDHGYGIDDWRLLSEPS